MNDYTEEDHRNIRNILHVLYKHKEDHDYHVLFYPQDHELFEDEISKFEIYKKCMECIMDKLEANYEYFFADCVYRKKVK